MKLLIKIFFFILVIFQINISEAKVFVFDNVVSEIRFALAEVKNVNEPNQNIENDSVRRSLVGPLLPHDCIMWQVNQKK